MSGTHFRVTLTYASIAALASLYSFSLNPSPKFHSCYNALNRHHVGCVTRKHTLTLGHFQHAIKSARYLGIQSLQDFVTTPLVVHIILDALEVGHCDAAGIT